MKIKYLLILILLFGSVYTASAQFEIDAQLRPRYEYRNGYRAFRDSTTEAANYVSQRTRLRFSYKKDSLELKISFQDVHVWGDYMPKTTPAGYIGLHEGWAKFRFKYNLFVQVGKQEIVYDNKRVLTQANWNQIGFTHDAIKLGYRTNKWEIETFFAYNQSSGLFGDSYYPSGSIYKRLNTLWVSRKFEKTNSKISFLAFNDVRQTSDSVNIDYSRITGGPILNLKFNNIGFDFRAFYQGGKLQSGQKVSAYFINSDIKAKFNKKINANLGFELMSGTDATDTLNTTNNTFDVIYGTRHSFNGLMDYFISTSSTGGSGLVDVYLKANVPVSPKVTVGGQWHYFRLQNNFIDASNNVVSKNLGNEFDFTAKIKFSKIVTLDLAYCFMLANEPMEVIRGGDKDLFNSYGYAMLTIKPTLFKK